jgi:histidinol dehydrogenase
VNGSGSGSGSGSDNGRENGNGKGNGKGKGSVSGGSGGEGAVFGVRGRLASLSRAERERLFDRGRAADAEVEAAVRGVIDEVRRGGDHALRDLALRFDGVRLESLEVPLGVCRDALDGLDREVRSALEQAAENIAAFHRVQLPAALEIEAAPGMRLGRRPDPLQRVGVYAPGGRAAYPSSVLMGVVPAKVAGVREVIVCSPPDASGLPPSTVLAACALAGADRVFAVGGAGAVAALALGTDSVPRVDKVVGPGNAYVTEAKRQLTGHVAIDSPAGPSEILVIADSTADATLIAVELLAQAEHDPDAASVLVTTDAALADAVAARTAELLGEQPREAIIRAALAARGALLVVDSLEQAVQFAGEYAPEHLLVMTREPRSLLPSLRAAGTIFLGAPSSVAFGDYMTGANHVLPTAGLARAYSGLSTLDFIRWTTYQELNDAAAAGLAAATSVLAEAEGLPAHALAARMRAGDADAAGAGSNASTSDLPRAAANETHARRADSGPSPGDVRQADTGAAYAGHAGGRGIPMRAAYRELSLYDPGRLPCPTDLSDNTNLFGAPPSLQRAPMLQDGSDGSRITRYPSVYATDLKRALADTLGVEPENVTTGCGSDDVIDSAIRAFCEPGDALAYPEPTFGMVPAFARMNAVRAAPVPLLYDFALDADALIAAQARITYLCRPNNPTGTAFERAATERVCTSAGGVVLVDEAYADFADDDLAQYAVASDRTVVLRTLSKAYGMAGLRIGFAVGPAGLIAEIEKSRGPYKVGGVAEAAALAVLSRDRGWIDARVAEVRQNRERLFDELRDRGVTTWPSAANFVLLRVPGSAAEWNGELRARGVAVRPFARLRGAGGGNAPAGGGNAGGNAPAAGSKAPADVGNAGECLRVTVGPWSMMERFLTAFDDVLNTMR